VLALVLQTYGLSTAVDPLLSSTAQVKSQPGEEVDDIFNPYWTERVTADFRTPLLTRLFNTLLRNHRGSAAVPLSEVIRIRAAIHRDSYGSDFGHFERDVKYVEYAPTLPGCRTTNSVGVLLTHLTVCHSTLIGRPSPAANLIAPSNPARFVCCPSFRTSYGN
jgi:hypothetical protein